MGMIICGVDCNDCIYSTIDETNKARIKVSCDAKGKEYFFGQCIPCELKVKRVKKNEEEEETVAE